MIRRCAACRDVIRPGATVAVLTLKEVYTPHGLHVSADLGEVEEAMPDQHVAHLDHASAAVTALGRDWQRRLRLVR